MKRKLTRAISLLALIAMLCATSVTTAQQKKVPDAQRVKQLFDRLADEDWADDADADEIRELLKRVEQGKPLTPEQFAKLFAKVQKNMPGQGATEHAKNNEIIRRAFRPVVKQANMSTIAVLKGGKQVAMGTVIDGKGHVLTKASELKTSDDRFSATINCKLAGGQPRKAKIVGVSDVHDLALLKIDPTGLKPVRWHQSGQPPVGSWLATTGLGDDPVAIGVVSVPSRKIGNAGGFLGVMLGQADNGPNIEKIVPKSAAADAGLQLGDVVTKINSKPVKTREEMVETVRNYKPGEAITLAIVRKGKKIKVRVTLGRRDLSSVRAGRLHAMNLMGGALSGRRTSFPNAMQHDTVLKPRQCGGPLVDLDGNVIGINIARAGRVMSYAVPAATIVAVLPELQSGKLAPKPDQIAAADKPAALAKTKPELEAVLDDIREAEAELRESQEKLRKAREALEKAGKK